MLRRENSGYPQVLCALMFPELALLGGSAMGEYEVYAFKAGAIASLRPKSHQSRTQEAKEVAIEMLRGRGIAAAGARTKLPTALIILVPKDRQLRAIGWWLCRRCLNRQDVLEVVAAAFGRVVPGMRVEAVQ